MGRAKLSVWCFAACVALLVVSARGSALESTGPLSKLLQSLTLHSTEQGSAENLDDEFWSWRGGEEEGVEEYGVEESGEAEGGRDRSDSSSSASSRSSGGYEEDSVEGVEGVKEALEQVHGLKVKKLVGVHDHCQYWDAVFEGQHVTLKVFPSSAPQALAVLRRECEQSRSLNLPRVARCIDDSHLSHSPPFLVLARAGVLTLDSYFRSPLATFNQAIAAVQQLLGLIIGLEKRQISVGHLNPASILVSFPPSGLHLTVLDLSGFKGCQDSAPLCAAHNTRALGDVWAQIIYYHRHDPVWGAIFLASDCNPVLKMLLHADPSQRPLTSSLLDHKCLHTEQYTPLESERFAGPTALEQECYLNDRFLSIFAMMKGRDPSQDKMHHILLFQSDLNRAQVAYAHSFLSTLTRIISPPSSSSTPSSSSSSSSIPPPASPHSRSSHASSSFAPTPCEESVLRFSQALAPLYKGLDLDKIVDSSIGHSLTTLQSALTGPNSNSNILRKLNKLSPSDPSRGLEDLQELYGESVAILEQFVEGLRGASGGPQGALDKLDKLRSIPSRLKDFFTSGKFQRFDEVKLPRVLAETALRVKGDMDQTFIEISHLASSLYSPSALKHVKAKLHQLEARLASLPTVTSAMLKPTAAKSLLRTLHVMSDPGALDADEVNRFVSDLRQICRDLPSDLDDLVQRVDEIWRGVAQGEARETVEGALADMKGKCHTNALAAFHRDRMIQLSLPLAQSRCYQTEAWAEFFEEEQVQNNPTLLHLCYSTNRRDFPHLEPLQGVVF